MKARIDNASRAISSVHRNEWWKNSRASTFASTSTSSPSSAATIRLSAARSTRRSHVSSGSTGNAPPRERTICSSTSTAMISTACERIRSQPAPGAESKKCRSCCYLPTARHFVFEGRVRYFSSASFVEELRIDALRGGDVVAKPFKMEFHGASRGVRIMRLDRVKDGLVLRDHSRNPSLLGERQPAIAIDV